MDIYNNIRFDDHPMRGMRDRNIILYDFIKNVQVYTANRVYRFNFHTHTHAHTDTYCTRVGTAV